MLKVVRTNRVLVTIVAVTVGLLATVMPARAETGPAVEPELFESVLTDDREVDLAELGEHIELAAVVQEVIDAAVDAGVVTEREAAEFEFSGTVSSCSPGGDPLSFLIRAVFCMVDYYVGVAMGIVNEAIGDVFQALDFVLNHLLPLLLCLTLGNHPCF